MAVLKIKTIDSALKKKGFRYDPVGKKHIVIRFYHDGKMTSIKTHYSHGDYEIDDYLIFEMANQIRLTKSEFCKYVSCAISENGYIEILKSKNALY